ncbi:MAG: dUTP diphosphatase [Ruminococcus sp.]|nr:dUTP diphosphatase [Ruminococcus sp.]
MYISIQRLRQNAKLPSQATKNSAGYDLYACLDEPLTITPEEICKIPTGIAVSPSRSDVALCIFPRSGLSAKYGITLANAVGLVDSDYRGEIQVALIHHGSVPFVVEPGMRIAQLVVFPILTPELREVTALDETERGAGGFGSSGLS